MAKSASKTAKKVLAKAPKTAVKTTAKKTVVKSAPTKAVVKKAPKTAVKTTAKKSVVKSAPKKAVVKKAPAKKVVKAPKTAVKTTAKKSVVKSAPKKAVVKKVTTKAQTSAKKLSKATSLRTSSVAKKSTKTIVKPIKKSTSKSSAPSSVKAVLTSSARKPVVKAVPQKTAKKTAPLTLSSRTKKSPPTHSGSMAKKTAQPSASKSIVRTSAKPAPKASAKTASLGKSATSASKTIPQQPTPPKTVSDLPTKANIIDSKAVPKPITVLGDSSPQGQVRAITMTAPAGASGRRSRPKRSKAYANESLLEITQAAPTTIPQLPPVAMASKNVDPVLPAPEPIKPKKNIRYSDKDLKDFLTVIHREKEKTIDELRMLKERLEDLTNYEASEETAVYSMHMAEQGSEAIEREKTYAQIQRMNDYLRKLDDAMKRIEDKTYGICRQCGILIARERLMAVPITTLSATWKIRQRCPDDGLDKVGRF